MPAFLDLVAERATSLATTPAQRLAAQHAIADTIACIVAGQSDLATRTVRDGTALEIAGGGPSSLVGGGTASPAGAAFVNGTAAHALDFDDNFGPGMSHASAVMLPAILAAGEAVGIDGAGLIEAYLVGLEAQALVGRGIGREHYVSGWHATATVGAIGSAAGVANVLGLGHDEMVMAMSLATSMAAGPKAQLGTPAKPFHAGMAARNATQAAWLARAGLTGRPDVLERGMGFGDLTNGGGKVNWQLPPEGTPHVIETDGLSPKIHPCCGSTHNSVDMVLDLRHEYGFAPTDIESITLIVGRANYRNLSYPSPVTETEARFSMQYCVALALYQDVLSLADFHPGAPLRPHLQALFPRIDMQVMPLEEELAAPRPAHRAEVVLKDGRTYSARRAYANGMIRQPLDDAARRSKVTDCFAFAGVPLDAAGLAVLEGIETVPDLSPLAALIAAPGPAPEALAASA